MGLVLGTRGRCLCGLRSPCYRPVGWGSVHQRPLLLPHPVHRWLTGRSSTSQSDALRVWALLLDLQCPWFSQTFLLTGPTQAPEAALFIQVRDGYGTEAAPGVSVQQEDSLLWSRGSSLVPAGVA